MNSSRRDFIKSAAMAAATAVLGGATHQHIHAAEGADGLLWQKAPCRFCGTGCGTLVGVKDGRVVKGTNFEGLRDVGDPVELAARYEAEGADEVVFLDISATREGRGTLLDTVRRTAEVLELATAGVEAHRDHIATRRLEQTTTGPLPLESETHSPGFRVNPEGNLHAFFVPILEPVEIGAVLLFSAENPSVNGAVLHANLGQVET